jgi:hypothetical protein
MSNSLRIADCIQVEPHLIPLMAFVMTAWAPKPMATVDAPAVIVHHYGWANHASVRRGQV